jgi:hypothetical protein
LSTGAKIAIGCGIVLFLAVTVTVVGFVGAAWWARGKIKEATGTEERIGELQRKANANEFTRPPDGVVTEDRLLKFLEVRRRVHSIYERNKEQIESAKGREQPSLGDITKVFSFVNDIRLVQAEAQADAGMSEEEYRFLVESVYKTMWASEVAKSTGGESFSEAAGEALESAAEAMAKADAEAPDPQAGDAAAARDAAREAAETLRRQAREVRERAGDLDVPEANIALFRKHEAEIRKYAMSGLEWIGL